MCSNWQLAVNRINHVRGANLYLTQSTAEPVRNVNIIFGIEQIITLTRQRQMSINYNSFNGSPCNSWLGQMHRCKSHNGTRGKAGISWLPPLSTMNVLTKLNGNSFNSSSAIKVWTKATDQQKWPPLEPFCWHGYKISAQTLNRSFSKMIAFLFRPKFIESQSSIWYKTADHNKNGYVLLSRI